MGYGKGICEIRGLSSQYLWDYENGYHWFGDIRRFGTFLAHADIYRMTLGLPGDIAEFGVFKGNTLLTLFAFREMFETSISTRIYGYDMFGEFPSNEIKLKNDQDFITNFTSSAGYGTSIQSIESLIAYHRYTNYELISGDVRTTVPPAKENVLGNIRYKLVNLDMDVYEPTKHVLNAIWPVVVRGGIVMLDDYSLAPGETLAVDEFLEAHPDLELKKTIYNDKPAYIIK